MDIKQLRLDKGWTQEDLARHSGLSTRTIQRAESGKHIGFESIKCLAAVFDINTDTALQTQSSNSTNQPVDFANKQTGEQPAVKLNQTEKSAIKFAQSLFSTDNKKQPDTLTKIERDAINYGKRLITKLKS